MLFLLTVFLVMSVVTALISLPLIAHKIGPNRFYGFRVRKTLENRELWFAVNEFFARRLVIVAAAEAFVSIVLYLVPDVGGELYAFSVMLVFIVAFAVAMSQTMQYMNSFGS